MSITRLDLHFKLTDILDDAVIDDQDIEALIDFILDNFVPKEGS